MFAAYRPAFTAFDRDLLCQVRPDCAGALDLHLVRVELPLDEGPGDLDDAALFVGEGEVHRQSRPSARLAAARPVRTAPSR